ncbi:uncharacterized protein CLUP02_09870 [Colletotrichum lupini]|uniref:Uncharacterized protein n=1 Tax=Colletotrichum lupini TaxID=145971 RepID=A0A9Q8SVI7_9PEZI|nr:uncharacterized protein CLUP02_09870 [Colletotrichum lupini]UQC84374.1 hypothetical protein CLUP02_09870 [Colletotrichum lupini]
MPGISPSSPSGDEAPCLTVPAESQGPCDLCLSISRSADDEEKSSATHIEPTCTTSLRPDKDADDKHGYWSEDAKTWRPTWLQPAVLLAFVAFFLVSTIALPAMFCISLRNNGLLETRESLVHIWRFGPTAMFTLISIGWSRVEMQTLRYMPWIACNQESLDRVLETKTLSRLPRRRYCVALKIQIVLAPGLYSIQTIEAINPIDIEILDSFNTTIPAWQSRDTRPYYMAQAIGNFDMGYPFGVNEQISYQIFKRISGSRGTVDSPIEATVAGLSTETQPESTFQWLRGATIDTWIPEYHQILRQNNWKLFSLGKPFCFDQTNIIPTINSSSLDFDLAAVLCSSGLWVSRVKVTDNGTMPLVEVLPDENRYPITANLWDLIGNSVPFGFSWNQSNINRVSGPVDTAYSFFGNLSRMGVDSSGASLYTNEVLYRSVMDMSRILGPWIGHYRLRHSDGQYLNATGAVFTKVTKLMVNKWTCLSMTTNFGLEMLMVALVLLFFENMTMIWYRDLLTVIGNMIFLQHQRRSSDGGSKDSPKLKDKAIEWGNCDFTPLVLKVWARASIISLIVVVTTGLSYSLKTSMEYQGIATVSEEANHAYLLWTSVPTLLMLSIALYINSFDSTYRGLATLSALAIKSCRVTAMDMSFSNMLGLQILYHSLRAHIGTVTVTQFLAIICSLLTTLASVVFTIKTIPETSTISLQQKTWFGSGEIRNATELSRKRQTLSSLVLRQGDGLLTYPKNTYDTLVFPTFGPSDGLDPSQNISIKVNMSVAMLKPNCWIVPPDVYNLTKLERIDDSDGYFTVQPQITESFTCPNGSQAQLSQTIAFVLGERKSDYAYLATGLDSPEDLRIANRSCGLSLRDTDTIPASTKFMTYALGKYSQEQEKFFHLSITRWDLPRPDESRAQPWGMPFNIPDIRDALPEVMASDSYAGYFDSWFRILSVPFGRFSLDAFGDPNFEEEILIDIHHLYGFLAAQLVNLENRIDITQNSKDSPPPTPFNLTANVINLSRRRLVQDPIVTYVIIGILTLTALLSLLMLITESLGTASSKSQLFSMRIEGLAPDGYNSIAAMTALLKDSNAMDHLPEGAEHMSKKELHEKLSGLRFRLGWFWRESTQTRHYTIGVLDDENFDFLGNKDEIAREDALLRHPPERGR